MPRIQQHIFCDIGVINTNSSRSIFEPKGFTPKPSESTFMIVQNTKDTIICPCISSQLHQCSRRNIFYKNSNDIRRNEGITFYEMSDGEFNKMHSIKFDFDIRIGAFLVLSERFMIAYFPGVSYTVDMYTKEIQEIDYVSAFRLMETVFFQDIENNFLTPIIVGDKLKLVKFTLPPLTNVKVIEIINTKHPSFFFLDRNFLFHVSIVGEFVQITEQPKIADCFIRDGAKKCFFSNGIYYFHVSFIDDTFIGYDVSGDKSVRSFDVSGAQYNNLIHVDEVIYGLVDDLMIPLSVECNISGFGLLPDIHCSLFVRDGINFPIIATHNHMMSIDIFSDEPNVSIYGAVEEGTKTFFNLEVYVDKGEITKNQLYMDRDEVFVYDGDDLLYSDHMVLDKYDSLWYISGAMIFLGSSFNASIFINSVEYSAPAGNDWLVCTASGNTMWLTGSTFTGIVVFDSFGKVTQFSTVENGEDSYVFVLPNFYNPLLALSFNDTVSCVRYNPDTRTFCSFTVEEAGNSCMKRNCNFVDEDVVLLENRMYRITNDTAERIDLELPWNCRSSIQYNFQVFKQTLYRLHLHLDGYDLVFDTLKFKDNYTSYDCETKKCNILEAIKNNGSFFPISEVRKRFLQELVQYNHNNHPV
ncbi:hypothetical protein PCE1_000976 [Barthelona sp. PCE]